MKQPSSHISPLTSGSVVKVRKLGVFQKRVWMLRHEAALDKDFPGHSERTGRIYTVTVRKPTADSDSTAKWVIFFSTRDTFKWSLSVLLISLLILLFLMKQRTQRVLAKLTCLTLACEVVILSVRKPSCLSRDFCKNRAADIGVARVNHTASSLSWSLLSLTCSFHNPYIPKNWEHGWWCALDADTCSCFTLLTDQIVSDQTRPVLKKGKSETQNQTRLVWRKKNPKHKIRQGQFWRKEKSETRNSLFRRERRGHTGPAPGAGGWVTGGRRRHSAACLPLPRSVDPPRHQHHRSARQSQTYLVRTVFSARFRVQQILVLGVRFLWNTLCLHFSWRL